MCLIVFAHQVHPEYPLIVVANRDENYQRPTQPADWWPFQPPLLAGKDLQAGGTWMGVSAEGRWSAVTNYREAVKDLAPRSRGTLTVDFLQDQNVTAPEYVKQVAGQGAEYGGFNLLAGDSEQLAYCSNRGGKPQLLASGVYTLSNHLLNTPWPKCEQARFKLEHQLRLEKLTVEGLMEVLSDRTAYDDHHLPHTGVGIAMERLLSPPFIVSDSYGTRSTTVLLRSKHNEVVFAEQNYVAGKKAGSLRIFQFLADAP